MQYWVAYYGAKLCGPYLSREQAEESLKGWRANYHEDCTVISEALTDA